MKKMYQNLDKKEDKYHLVLREKIWNKRKNHREIPKLKWKERKKLEKEKKRVGKKEMRYGAGKWNERHCRQTMEVKRKEKECGNGGKGRGGGGGRRSTRW